MKNACNSNRKDNILTKQQSKISHGGYSINI